MQPVSTFAEVASPWLVTALQAPPLSYTEPLPIQRVVLPQVCAALASGIHMDVCLTAPTGAGKTLCYLVPMLRHVAALKAKWGDVQIRGVVLVPTKALGHQVASIATTLGAAKGIQVGLCCGDDRDEAILTKTVTLCGGIERTFAAVDIVIATPQKFMKQLILAHASINQLSSSSSTSMATQGDNVLSFVEMLVIDEADDILTGIFTNFACRISDAIEKCVSAAKHGRPVHRLLCSATLTARIANISELRLKNAKTYALDAAGVQDEAAAAGGDAVSEGRVRSTIALPPSLEEHVVIVRQEEKRHAVLLNILQHVAKQQQEKASADSVRSTVLVFVSTPDQARVLSHFITRAGMRTLEFTAAATEAERRSAVVEAYSGTSCVVIATDALMRGIDLPGVTTVVMYDAPRTLQQYVHRIGRTARAGKDGKSYLLLSREGVSGTLEDGEVAVFKSFDPFLKRCNPVIHDHDLRDVDAILDRANELLEHAKTSLQKGWTSAATVAAARQQQQQAKTKRLDGAQRVAGDKRQRTSELLKETVVE